MKYGKKLLWGLLAASSWAIPATNYAAGAVSSVKWLAGGAPATGVAVADADQPARQASALAQRNAQTANAAPNLPSSVTIAPDGAVTVTDAIRSDVSLPAWKRTESAPTVDIRFKKPAGTISADRPARIADKAAKKPSIQQQQGAALAVAVPASIMPAVPAVPAVQALPAIPALPAAQASSVSTAAYAKPAQPDAAEKKADELQLVAQIQDADVRNAVEDEPLPVAPQEQRPNGNKGSNGMNGSNGHNDAKSINRDNIFNSEGDCNDECCAPQPCLFWTAGVEATFLNPDLNSSGGTSFAVEQIDEDRYDICSTDTSEVDSLYMSPRIWLGVQGCCWGADVRYWHLQASEGEYDPSIGGLGSWDGYDCGRPDLGFFSCSRLEAYTIDLELTRRFCLNDCQMQAAFGVRHADLEINEGITGLAATDQGILSGFARANRQTRGTGFLLGLYGRKPIFPCSCINWFYNARWSALWGPTQTAAETFAAVQSTDPDFIASAGSVNGAYTNVDDTLFIGEFQLGLEWNYALSCLPANAFFRAAIEYQRWDGGPGSSEANSFAGITIINDVDPTSIVDSQATALAPQLDLIGFTLGTGLTW